MYSSVSVGLEAGGITRTRRDGDVFSSAALHL